MRWIALATVFFSLPAAAETVLVLPIVARGRVDQSALHKVEQELERGLSDRGATVSRSATEADVRKCKDKPVCLAALGQKASAQRILSGRASAEGKSFTVQFVLLSSDTGAQVQTTSLAFAAGADVAKVVAEALQRVVPVEESEMPALQALVSSKKKGPRSLDSAALDSGSPELAAPVKASASPGRVRSLLYTGIAVAALGAAGLGTGLAFGSMALATKNSVTDQTRQVEADAAEKRGNQQVNIANAAMGVGGGLLGVGVALIVSDVILHRRAQARLSVSADGIQGGFEVPF